MTGLVVCVAVLAAATVYGAVWRRRSGKLRVAGARRRIRRPPVTDRAAARGADGGAAASAPPPGNGAEGGPAAATEAGRGTGVLTAAQLGRSLGSRATLVQFSTAFCAPCRATRRILAEVADMTEGVAHVEVDAEDNLALVRSLGIHATPTVLVLGPDGVILRRGTGQPRKPDVIAALGAVPPPGAGPGPATGATGGRTAPAGPGAAAPCHRCQR